MTTKGLRQTGTPLLVAALWCVASGLTQPVWAEEATADAALQELLMALEQETEIATKTRMNIDFVPGMVSVLYGDDLLAKGVRSAGEAMALIPGVELSLSSDGQTQVFVRGIGTAFASGKIKVLLNGIPFNSTLSVATTALRIPVEQVERLEVIRGPGSAIYGEFAYSGVINIVTRQAQNQVFAHRSSLGETTAGAVLTRQFDDRDWQMSLSFSGTWLDGDEVESGRDVLRNSPMAGISNAPGITNEKERDSALIFQTRYEDFRFSAQWVRVESGDYFGLAHALPSYGPELIREASMLSVNAQQHWELKPQLSLDASIGWLDYQLDSGLHEFYPAGFRGINPATLQPYFPNGVLGSPNYEERKYRAAVELAYSGWERHELLAGFEWLYTEQGDTFAERNYDPNTQPFDPVPLQKYRGTENWLEEDLTRRVFGLYLQDQISLSERLTVTAGMRFDTYDDVGDAFSPRLAAVYQLRDHQTLKVQYAEAFRPPTFLETATQNNPVVSGNPDIESERIKNYELGYIYNNGMMLARTTLFYADLHELIVIDPATNAYANKGTVHVYGAEQEFARQFGRNFELEANVAVVQPIDQADDEVVADVARVTGNLGLTYRPLHDLSGSLRFRYVGTRERAPADARSSLAGYRTVDLTVVAQDVAGSGFSIRGGVKNLFDEEVVYPAPLVSFGGSVLPAYEDDYPRPGREYWLQTDYRF